MTGNKNSQLAVLKQTFQMFESYSHKSRNILKGQFIPKQKFRHKLLTFNLCEFLSAVEHKILYF